MTRVLLLHGWDWEKYPVFEPKHQWHDRQELIVQLQGHYGVDYPSLPGFDPHDARRTGSWTLDDYADWLQEQIVEQHHDAIIGYSFGCAVAVHRQYLHPSPALPLILLSPALTRAYKNAPNRVLAIVAGMLKRLRMERAVNVGRKLYLTCVVKNPHVLHGTPFLQSTYSNIVSLDLSGELAQLIEADCEIMCVFGGQDTATPPEMLFARTPAARPLSIIIPAGTHDIGRTHSAEVVDHIVDFLSSLKAQRCE
ncbi:MAG: alpha/beta fold hydrolase [Egibacteraceae bacterium]